VLLLHRKIPVKHYSLLSSFLPFSQGPSLESNTEEASWIDHRDVDYSALSEAERVALIQQLTQEDSKESAEEIERIRALSTAYQNFIQTVASEFQTFVAAATRTIGEGIRGRRAARTQKLFKIVSASAPA